MKIHEKYINRCIELAKNGLGATYPNPIVGAVIVYNDTIIGEGWHQKAGEPHAEVFAIQSVKNKELLKHSTIYVSLEPCSHYGKTPPCSDLIVHSKIPNVVIGTIDSFNLVSGKGIEFLVKNGCKVTVGVLENECLEVNKRFFTYHNKKRPYIILKWAASNDGFIDIDRNVEAIDQATPTWISNLYSQQLVHQFRAEEQAILVGTETILKDNPQLNVRHISGQNPIRILLDQHLKIPLNYHVFNGLVKTMVFIDKNSHIAADYLKIPNLLPLTINFKESILEQVLVELHKNQIQSVIVEGGKRLLDDFIQQNYWDEARVFTGNSTLNMGIKAPLIKGVKINETKIVEDKLTIYLNKNAV